LALVGNPEVLVLDEVTTGLDPQARRDMWQLIEDTRDRGATLVLVTHFMEEAERLCDRVAVIHAGRVAALGTPAGLVARSQAPQRLRFRPTGPVDEQWLASLPQVTGVRRRGPALEVTGTGDLLPAVTAALAQQRVAATELHLEPATLDEAYLALTGQQIESLATGEAR